jgi:hypothetical protein
MSERDPGELERRLSAALHAVAPRPAPDLADRLLARTAASPQRRPLFSLALAPAMAATAVLIAAAAVGLGIGGLLPRGSSVGEPSVSRPATSQPMTTEATPMPATPVPSPSAVPTGTCENEPLGYAVDYPADWWANERIVTDPELTPIEACQYFAEEPVELQQNAGLPPDVAIVAGLEDAPAGNPQQPIRVLAEREVEVAGRPARVREIEWTADTGFQRVGDRSYAYRIDLPNGETLRFGTLDQQPSVRYEARKAVLDAMMETLRLIGD